MKHRISHRSTSVLFQIATLAILAAASGSASAGVPAAVPCETFNECTVGTCLPNGTCEAEPGNNGADCETSNPCATGTCNDGSCVEVPRNNGSPCESFDPCMEKDGVCTGGTCTADAIPNGEPCREDVLGPCLFGTCQTFGPFSACIPEPKCGAFDNPCEFDCNPLTGACEPFETHICDDACTTATCVPGGDEGYTCEDRINRPNQTACEDGSTCTTNDKCDDGQCIGETGSTGPVCGNNNVESPEECDDGDTEFAAGEACDSSCELVPCGKPTNSTGQLPKSSDALFILKVSVQTETCVLTVCDVNNSGTITSSDALLTLKKAVSSPVNLVCPTGGGGA